MGKDLMRRGEVRGHPRQSFPIQPGPFAVLFDGIAGQLIEETRKYQQRDLRQRGQLCRSLRRADNRGMTLQVLGLIKPAKKQSLLQHLELSQPRSISAYHALHSLLPGDTCNPSLGDTTALL